MNSAREPSVHDRLNAFLSADEQPEQAPAPTQTRAAPSEPVEEYDGEPVAQAAQAAEQPEQAQDTSGIEVDEEAVEIGTLQDLAQHLGVDVADLYNIRLPVTGPDGRQEVSLGEWKDGYQEVAKVRKLEAEINEQRSKFETERTQVQELLYRQSIETQALLESAEQALIADFQRIDWNALRTQNPAEWAAKQTEFQARQRQIEEAKGQAANRYMQLQQQQQQEHQARMAELLQREAQLLTERIPEWRDATKAQTEKAALREYLIKSGYSPDDVNSVADSRAISLARKAWLYDQMQTKAKAQKAVVKIGKKVLKPGSRDATSPQAEQVQKLRLQLRKSGSHKDAAALISRLI